MEKRGRSGQVSGPQEHWQRCPEEPHVWQTPGIPGSWYKWQQEGRARHDRGLAESRSSRSESRPQSTQRSPFIFLIPHSLDLLDDNFKTSLFLLIPQQLQPRLPLYMTTLFSSFL